MRPPANACASSRSAASWPIEGARLARVREALEPIGLGQRLGLLHGGRAGHQRHAPQQPALDVAPDLGGDRVGRTGAIDHHAALRLGLGDREIAGAQALVELQVALLEGDRRRTARRRHCASGGRRRARGRLRRRRSRIKRQIGTRRRHRPCPPALQAPPAQPAGDALIDAGRIREAVADHPAPRRQRRPDGLVQVIGPGGIEQQRLRQRRMRGVAGSRIRARTCSANGDPPGSRVSTASMPRALQPVGQQPRLRGLAGALAALEGDEPARGHGQAPARASAGPRLLLELRYGNHRVAKHRIESKPAPHRCRPGSTSSAA